VLFRSLLIDDIASTPYLYCTVAPVIRRSVPVALYNGITV